MKETLTSQVNGASTSLCILWSLIILVDEVKYYSICLWWCEIYGLLVQCLIPCMFQWYIFILLMWKRVKQISVFLFCVKRSFMTASELCTPINWFRPVKDMLLTVSTHICRYNLLDLVDHFDNRGLYRQIFLRYVLKNQVSLWGYLFPFL